MRRDGTQEVLSYKDFIILTRKKALGVKFAKGLKARGIPVIFVGESNLFATPVVRDFMCFLKVAQRSWQSGNGARKINDTIRCERTEHR